MRTRLDPGFRQVVEHGACVQRADRHAGIGRDAALALQHQVAQAAHAQEGREIARHRLAAAMFGQFIVQAGDQLVDGHVVAPRQLFQHFPEQALQPDAGGHAMQAQRARLALVRRRIGADKDFTHGCSRAGGAAGGHVHGSPQGGGPCLSRVGRRVRKALMYDPRAQHGKELRQPGRMRGPGRGSDEVAVGMGLVNGNIGIGAAGQLYLGRAGRVGGAGLAFEHACRGQQLGAVADRGDRLVRLGEVAHDLQHARVQAQVFRGAAAGDDQCVVTGGGDLGKGRVEGEVVAALFGVGLVALEVMDGGGAGVARLLVRAGRMHGVADHLQCLERHHGFVVFGVVAHQHQNLLCHRGLLYGYGCPAGAGRSSPAPWLANRAGRAIVLAAPVARVVTGYRAGCHRCRDPLRPYLTGAPRCTPTVSGPLWQIPSSSPPSSATSPATCASASAPCRTGPCRA
ncbi:conserved hypothetical protein [Cupriavidus necator]|uniref:Uncharacterized protein n=1 Tax=Cupriavidus necator TaxID=106590 RepID=A0A1K0IIG2_CUPNE|nr:conserved hypothetical protein [Cupriavidus necator]